jgi:hypothetical protein
VHDPGPLRVAAGEASVEQALDERAGSVPGTRVDDEPGRLVDDEQVLVLVGDPQVERLLLQLGRGEDSGVQRDLLAADQLMALRARLPVDGDGAGGQETLCRGP